MKRSTKAAKPRISPDEKEQVRIRRKLGHTFAMGQDAKGHDRLRAGTAESRRAYDESNTGIVRLRLYDPLTDLKLSMQQRKAGAHYRNAYEAIAMSGIKSSSFAEHVDGGGQAKDIPAPILDAWRTLRALRSGIHPSIVLVMDHVCGLRMSIREAAHATGFRRDAVSMLLVIGLDVVAGPNIHHKNSHNRRNYIETH